MGTNSPEYQRQYYAANKARRKAQLAGYTRKINERNQEWVLRYLHDHPCVDCGEDDIIVLEFDHVRGVKTKGGVASMLARASITRLEDEVEKCEVVCANCHRRRTAKQFKYWRYLGACSG